MLGGLEALLIIGPVVFYFWLTGVDPEIQKMAGGTLFLAPLALGFAVFGWLGYRRKQLYRHGASARAAGQAG